MIAPTSRKSSSSKPRIVAGGRADPDPRGDRRRPLVERDGVAVDGDLHLGEPLLGVLARPLRRAQVDLQQVRVGAAGEHVEPALAGASRPACRRSRAPGVWYSRKASVAAIRKQVAFAAIVCSSGPPCMPGKTARSIAWACSSRQRMKPARGPASVLCVVEVTKWQSLTGFGCSPAATRPGEVRHVAEQQRADLVGDLAEAVGLDRARVGRAAADDQLRPVLLGQREHVVVVDQVRLARDAVVDDRVEPPGEVDLEAVRQVAAVRELEREDRVARLQAPPCTRPCSSARLRAAGRSRARRRTAPWRGRSPSARSRRRPRSRRSSAGPDSPRRTCSSAPSRAPRRSPAR